MTTEKGNPSYVELVDAIIGMVCQHLTKDEGDIIYPDVSSDEIAIDILKKLRLIENNRIVDEAFNIDWLRYKLNFDFNPGEPISCIYAQPGNDTTWGIVTRVADKKIHVYDPFFGVHTEINIKSKKYWATTNEEVNRKVDGELIWDVLRKARKELGLSPND